MKKQEELLKLMQFLRTFKGVEVDVDKMERDVRSALDERAREVEAEIWNRVVAGYGCCVCCENKYCQGCEAPSYYKERAASTGGAR